MVDRFIQLSIIQDMMYWNKWLIDDAKNKSTGGSCEEDMFVFCFYSICIGLDDCHFLVIVEFNYQVKLNASCMYAIN